MKSILLLALLSAPAIWGETSSRELKLLKDEVAAVRRDQLSYQIERDLLKETFASNIATLNTAIAIVLATFTAIGFIGLKDLYSLKKSYSDSLERLTQLHREFEGRCREATSQYEKLVDKFNQATKTNEDQDRRIKLLELVDRAQNLFKSKDYSRALEYCDIGIELAKDSAPLWLQKAMCLFKLFRLIEAKDAFTRAAALEPDNPNIAVNMLELHLVLRDPPSYEALLSLKRASIEKYLGNFSAKFFDLFEIIKLYIQGNTAGMKSRMKLSLSQPAKMYSEFEYTEIHQFLSTNNTPEAALIRQYIQVLQGVLNKDTVVAQLG